jgi:hypothetical protein
MFWTRPQPKLWTEQPDARELVWHVAKWIDRRLLVIAACAVVREIDVLLTPVGRQCVALAEAWVRGEVALGEVVERRISLIRSAGHYYYMPFEGRGRIVTWEAPPDDSGPEDIPTRQLWAMLAAAGPARAISYPAHGALDAVVMTARALSEHARHPLVEHEIPDNAWWAWRVDAGCDDTNDVEWREFVTNLRRLADVIRTVIPYPRKGRLIAHAPGAYVVRTKPDRLGLQQPPQPPADGRPGWWDGWITGPDEEVLACIPDVTLMEQTMRTIWPSSSSSNATSAPGPLVTTSSAT